MRYGRNLPGGFLYLPDATGFRLNYKATLKPPRPDKPSVYLSLALRGSAVARDIFLDDNTFVHSHSVHKKTFVGLAILGLHYETQEWAAHFDLSYSSDDVDTSRAHKAADQTQVVRKGVGDK